MQKVTLKVDAYIYGKRVSVTTDGVAESNKRAKMAAYRHAMDALQSHLTDGRGNYAVVKIEGLGVETV